MTDPLDTEFVKHVRQYRPDSVTARLADEVERLRKVLVQDMTVIAEDTFRDMEGK